MDLVFDGTTKIPPAIPDGDHYELRYCGAEKVQLWGQTKLLLRFTMVTLGDWEGQEFFMACTVPLNGRWGPSSKYWLTWVLAAGRRPTRADRMSTAIFKHKVFRARMRTVTQTSKRIARTPAQQYSVVDELLDVTVSR